MSIEQQPLPASEEEAIDRAADVAVEEAEKTVYVPVENSNTAQYRTEDNVAEEERIAAIRAELNERGARIKAWREGAITSIKNPERPVESSLKSEPKDSAEERAHFQAHAMNVARSDAQLFGRYLEKRSNSPLSEGQKNARYEYLLQQKLTPEDLLASGEVVAAARGQQFDNEETIAAMQTKHQRGGLLLHFAKAFGGALANFPGAVYSMFQSSDEDPKNMKRLQRFYTHGLSAVQSFAALTGEKTEAWRGIGTRGVGTGISLVDSLSTAYMDKELKDK